MGATLDEALVRSNPSTLTGDPSGDAAAPDALPFHTGDAMRASRLTEPFIPFALRFPTRRAPRPSTLGRHRAHSELSTPAPPAVISEPRS